MADGPFRQHIIGRVSVQKKCKVVVVFNPSKNFIDLKQIHNDNSEGTIQ